MLTEEVTIREVFQALEQNGFEHIRENWTAETVKGAVRGACILGQGALNLGVLASGYENSLYEQLNRFSTQNTVTHREQGLGMAIVDWNDKYDYAVNNDGNPIVLSSGDYKKVYRLRTYKAVVNKAREILEPYFDETVTLAKHAWTYKRKDGTTQGISL